MALVTGGHPRFGSKHPQGTEMIHYRLGKQLSVTFLFFTHV